MKNTNNKKGILKKIIIFAAVAFVLMKLNEGNNSYYSSYQDAYCESTTYGDTYSESTTYGDTYYGDDIYDTDIYDDDIYVEDYSTGYYNDVVGIWSNEEGTIAIYDTGYAEITAGYESADYRWTASDAMISFDPCNHLEYEPVSLYYEINGNTLYITDGDDADTLYRN